MRLAVDHRKAFKKKSRYRSFCFSVGCQQCNGSLTVEASIVLPIFLSVIMALMSFFEVIQIQTRIQQGMKDSVTSAALRIFRTTLPIMKSDMILSLRMWISFL